MTGIFNSASNELQDRALEFDGDDDHVTVAESDQLRQTSFTIELWFKVPEAGGYRVLTSRQGEDWEDRNWWLTLPHHGRIVFKPSGIETSDSYEDGHWHHVAAVLDPTNTGQARLYVDGQLEAQGQAGTPSTTAAPMIVGAEADNFGSEIKRHCRGAIAEVRLWNDVRSGAEIREHMETPLSGDEDGLMGYWPLAPDNPGQDASGNGNQATVNGDPTETLFRPLGSGLPDERNVVLGETITLGPVSLRNPSGTVSYQWYRDGEAITDATDESLTIEEITGDDTGTYHVEVDDGREQTPVESAGTDVIVDDDAHFETDLGGQEVVTLGGTTTLGPVELEDPKGEVSYQWYRDGEPVAGASGSSLTISDITEADLGAYYVEVEDGWGTPVRSDTVEVLDRRAESIEELAEVTHETPPDEVYARFNRFCKLNFGAEKEPLIYEKFGDTLEILEDGSWQHVSETSAVIAWETNLPAEGSVAYGETSDLSQQTEPSERPFYIHVQYLTGLEPDTTYQYQPVVTDERGTTVRGPVRSFTTAPPEGDVVRIPEDLDGPPYDLTQADTTYVLTEDITAEGTAIRVPDAADAADVTLDLNGRTVVYNDGDVPEDATPHGIQSLRNDRLTIVNGTVKQGNGTNSEGNQPFYVLSSNGLDIAGVTVDYHTVQTDGIRLRYCGGDANVHHNVFLDRGTRVTNRNSMVKALRVEGSFEGLHPHHNLVKRTRQTGIDGGFPIEHNEVYVDSWPVNSFALQTDSNSESRHNRLFGTGVNPFGTGWATEGQVVKNNLVQFQGIDTRGNRHYESWGEQDALGGFRVTSYNGNTTPIEDNRFENNLVLINARDGSQARGTGFWSDPVVSDLRLTDSTIKVEAEDEETSLIGCVATQGDRKEDNNPVVYEDSEFLSNLAPIRFGDGYGQGWNHHFRRCTLRRTGDDDRFHTFVFDEGFDLKDHVILDCDFGEETAWDDVLWKRTGTGSEYTVKWTLTLRTQPNADVEITDVTDETVFTGSADADGNLEVPLAQATVSRPDESSLPTTETDITTKTPHTVSVSTDDGERTETVEMTEQRTVDLPGSPGPVADGNPELGFVDGGYHSPTDSVLDRPFLNAAQKYTHVVEDGSTEVVRGGIECEFDGGTVQIGLYDVTDGVVGAPRVFAQEITLPDESGSVGDGHAFGTHVFDLDPVPLDDYVGRKLAVAVRHDRVRQRGQNWSDDFNTEHGWGFSTGERGDPLAETWQDDLQNSGSIISAALFVDPVDLPDEKARTVVGGDIFEMRSRTVLGAFPDVSPARGVTVEYDTRTAAGAPVTVLPNAVVEIGRGSSATDSFDVRVRDADGTWHGPKTLTLTERDGG